MKTTWNGTGLAIDLEARTAYVRGAAISLGDRAFDILAVLIDGKDGTVSKSEIFKAVWGDEQLQENRLQVHISFLRKAIAKAAKLEPVRGVGYRLVPLDHDDAPPSEKSIIRYVGGVSDTNLPLEASELIGRERSLAEVAQLTGLHRLVTLTGAGGIGKTRLAVAAAATLIEDFPDGVYSCNCPLSAILNWWLPRSPQP